MRSIATSHLGRAAWPGPHVGDHRAALVAELQQPAWARDPSPRPTWNERQDPTPRGGPSSRARRRRSAPPRRRWGSRQCRSLDARFQRLLRNSGTCSEVWFSSVRRIIVEGSLASTASLTPGVYTTSGSISTPRGSTRRLRQRGRRSCASNAYRRTRWGGSSSGWPCSVIGPSPTWPSARPRDADRGWQTYVASSSLSQAGTRLCPDPMEWLYERSATQWAEASADRDRWRELALHGIDGTTVLVPDSDENRAHFESQTSGSTVLARSTDSPATR